MDAIFHEKQEGSLCAQHCLNTLLQGNYFTPVDLAELGKQLDEVEKQHMAEAGCTSDYQTFLNEPSSNYDDSGFFSIQVLQEAVKVWNLELLPFNSSAAPCRQARQDPRTQQAFICNFKEHWFTIRQLGHQWFNLNSLLSSPELLSDTYLSLFLTQLIHEGYSIFVVVGELPACEADQLLKLVPAVQTVKPRLLSEVAQRKGSRGSGFTDTDLQKALEESRRLDEEDDVVLKQALALSMQGYDEIAIDEDLPTIPEATPTPSAEEIRLLRLAHLDRQSNTSPQPATHPADSDTTQAHPATPHTGSGTTQDINEVPTDAQDEDMLAEAIKMSLDTTQANT